MKAGRLFLLIFISATLIFSLQGLNRLSLPDAPDLAYAELPPPENRQAAPGFTLSDLDGRPVRLSDYRGSVVLLGFWTTW